MSFRCWLILQGLHWYGLHWSRRWWWWYPPRGYLYGNWRIFGFLQIFLRSRILHCLLREFSSAEHPEWSCSQAEILINEKFNKQKKKIYWVNKIIDKWIWRNFDFIANFSLNFILYSRLTVSREIPLTPLKYMSFFYVP